MTRQTKVLDKKMENVKLRLLGISEIVGLEDVALLGLVDDVRKRQLVVTCDKAMRIQLQMHMTNKLEVSKSFPKVMSDILCSCGKREFEILISSVRNGEYKTEIRDLSNGNVFPIRCSDGILFSIVYGAPLYATPELMASQSVAFNLGETRLGLPLTVLNEEMLQQSLQKAIETENYEMASNLRDELNKRHSHNG